MNFNEKPWALIMAAGRGSRLAAAVGGKYKQSLPWLGMPLYRHSALAMSRSASVAGVIFVFPEELLHEEQQRLRELDKTDSLGLPWIAAAGGERRQDSVCCGLAVLPPHTRHVLVHDAARPFVSPALVRRVCEALSQGAEAVIPALPLTDTIKMVENNRICATLSREQLFAAQTPQGFDAALLSKAHARARKHGLTVTDDAALMEEAGHSVRLIDGERKNVKITNPEDLALIAKAPAPGPRVGMGQDVHRYGEGRPLTLGGVRIPGPEVVAHSDGDVLLHAVMDALLGCAGLGDIGLHFPDSEARFENISSALLLDEVIAMTRKAGLRPIHVDMTIVAQTPRIAPWREEIRNNVARLLNLPAPRVNLKAGTEEGMGFTGRGEGIKACAVVTALADEED